MDYSIIIGTISGTNNTLEKIDFSNPLSNKDDANLIIFPLMRAESIEKPEICEGLPDSTIYFNSWNEGVTYSIFYLWFNENNFIIENNVNSETPIYKKITDFDAEEFKKIIDKYKISSNT